MDVDLEKKQLLNRGHYAGYGYFDVSEQINSLEEFKSLVKQGEYYPDALT